MRTLILPVGAVAVGVGLIGCARTPSSAPPAAAPVPVTVSHPVEREVTDSAEFTARTAAVDSVEVRARALGYLQKVNFKEGDLVKEGDVLFEIDPRPYEALLNQAKAKVTQDEAQLEFDELGFGEPVGVSAAVGKGSGDLLDAVVTNLPPYDPAESEDTIDVPRWENGSRFSRLLSSMNRETNTALEPFAPRLKARPA